MNVHEELMLMLIVLSALFYAVSFVTALAGHDRLSFRVFAAAWLVNAMVIAGNYLLCGHPPFGNMYHVLCFWRCVFCPFTSLSSAVMVLGGPCATSVLRR